MKLQNIYCQTSVLFFSNGGILSGYLILLTLHLSGIPSLKTGTSPLAVNSSTTVYICKHYKKDPWKYSTKRWDLEIFINNHKWVCYEISSKLINFKTLLSKSVTGTFPKKTVPVEISES